VGNQIEGYRLENTGVHGGIILKLILKKQEGTVRAYSFEILLMMDGGIVRNM
jgi:hypothetical protein